MYEDINCPYCEAPQNINHDDGYGYEEGTSHQQQCVKCDKNFVFTTSISFYYEGFKADCLNEGEHDYQPTKTHPVEWTMMRCSMCDEERKPTKEEMDDIVVKYNEKYKS